MEKKIYHSFPVALAVEVGERNAIILSNFRYWVEFNSENGKNFIDGKHWTFNSVKALCDHFPYLNEGQIVRSIKDLEKSGFLESANYNKQGYDRTKWYTITDKARMFFDEKPCNGSFVKNDKSICYKWQIHLLNITIPFVKNDKPIPVYKPIYKTVYKPNGEISETTTQKKPEKKAVNKKTKEEIYNENKPAIIERITSSNVDVSLANKFADYRESRKEYLTINAINQMERQAKKADRPLSYAIKFALDAGWLTFKHEWWINRNAKNRTTSNGKMLIVSGDAQHGVGIIAGMGDDDKF